MRGTHHRGFALDVYADRSGNEGHVQACGKLHVDLLGVQVGRSVSAYDDVPRARPIDQLAQLDRRRMRVQVGERVVGRHQQVVDAASQDVLLQLGIVDGPRAHGYRGHPRALNGGAQLSCRFQSIQVVR